MKKGTYTVESEGIHFDVEGYEHNGYILFKDGNNWSGADKLGEVVLVNFATRKGVMEAFEKREAEAKEEAERAKEEDAKVKLKTAKAKKGKFDLKVHVTNIIIEMLEQGIIPWQKPWHGVTNGAFNRITKKPYSLFNQWILMKPGEWATMNQWNQLGGKIRKGEHPSMVVFWKIVRKEVEENGETKEKGYPMLRYYNVYHIDQVEGVEPLKDGLKEIEAIPEADDVIHDYITREGLELRETKSNQAFYSPLSDYVQIPLKEQFENSNAYYATAFHELTHSTGHKSRLNRFDYGAKLVAFGDEDYSKEELVAEIGSAGIMNKLGIETKGTLKNSAAYIQSWIRVLKNDKNMIVSASGKAEKAMKLILGEE